MTAVYVFLGGGLGSLLRWGTQIALGSAMGTLAVNLVGSLAIGFLSEKYASSVSIKAFMMVGILGGFTTFSAFALETNRMEGLLRLGLYIWISVFGALGLCNLGIYLAQKSS